MQEMNKQLAFNNTYDFGRLTFLILKESKSYTGVCLEFDLTVHAPTAEKAKEHIEDLASGWLKNVIKNHLPEELLNKSAPKKYWKMAKLIEKQIEARKEQFTVKKTPALPKSQELYFSIVQNYLGNSISGK